MYRALYDGNACLSALRMLSAKRPSSQPCRNQIAAGRIGHAYLFAGTRGAGETTCAKIFARRPSTVWTHPAPTLRRMRDLQGH